MFSILGPSILLLARLTRRKKEDISYAFTIRGAGYQITTLLVGFILDKFSVSSPTVIAIPRNGFLKYIIYRMNGILLTTSIFLMGTCMIITPFVHNYAVFLVLNLITAIAGGTVDCVSSVFAIRMWGKSATYYVTALHATYGIGAFVGPFYLQLVQNSMASFSSRHFPSYINTLSVAYVPIGLFVLTSLLLFAFVPFVDKKSSIREEGKRLAINDDDTQPVIQADLPWYKDRTQIVVGGLASLSLFLDSAVEGGFNSYISMYVFLYQRKHFQSTSSLLVSLYWFVFLCGRLAALPISKKLTIRQIMLPQGVVCVLVLLFLMLFPNHITIWICTPILGVAIACQYPCAFSAPTSQLNIKLSAFITSVMIVSASLGQTVCQTVIVHFLPYMFHILLAIFLFKMIIDVILLFS
ncbi:11 TM domain-containing transmembrane protein, partial [Acrasis kona]